jgi:hypothetical protein
MEHRFISKNFICENCNHRFKKLVSYDENTSSCNSCSRGKAHELEENEFNRENADRTYRLCFANGEGTTTNMISEYHPVTDILDRDPQNLYGDARRRYHPRRRQEGANMNGYAQQQQLRQGAAQQEQAFPRQQETIRRQNYAQQPTSATSSGLQDRQARTRPNRYFDLFYVPFSVSPFHGSVNSQTNNLNNNDLIFADIFVMPSNDFFMDNFASNFTSNFINPFQRIVFFQSMQNQQPQGNPPASREVLEKLKRFKMNQDYCKKDEKNILEYPACSICLTEIEEGAETVLMPCGHLYHDPCVVKWLKMHNTCPVCRYELPTDDLEYESEGRQRNNLNANNMNSNRTATNM